MKIFVLILFTLLYLHFVNTKCLTYAQGKYGVSIFCPDLNMFNQCNYGQTLLNHYINVINDEIYRINGTNYININDYNTKCYLDIECHYDPSAMSKAYCENQNSLDRCKNLQGYLDDLDSTHNIKDYLSEITCEPSETHGEGIEIYLYTGNAEEDKLVADGTKNQISWMMIVIGILFIQYV